MNYVSEFPRTYLETRVPDVGTALSPHKNFA
jgi:hypothetical protein